MYDFLEGTVSSLSEDSVVLQVGGIGYRLQASGRTLSRLEAGATVRLMTHLHVSDSAHSLFGFAGEGERSLFLRLLRVGGVGPSLALAMLSSFPPGDLASTILDGDAEQLVRVKGIGKKTAQRVVLELRDGLEKEGFVPTSGSPAPSSKGDLQRVLAELGFHEREASQALERAIAELGPDAEPDSLLRHALRQSVN